MLYRQIIVDADICMKLSASDKFKYLEWLLPQLSDEIFIHEYVFGEIRLHKEQIKSLVEIGKVKVLRKTDLSPTEESVYTSICKRLYAVMMDPEQPNKTREKYTRWRWPKSNRFRSLQQMREICSLL